VLLLDVDANAAACLHLRRARNEVGEEAEI